jgi:hypothetical protein
LFVLKPLIGAFFCESILWEGENLFVNSPTMKFLLLFLAFGCSFVTSAHESYFSFAEMEYDTECKCLEVTLTVSSHDLESSALNKKIIESQLENGLSNDLQRTNIITDIILEGFRVYQSEKEIPLFYVGHELLQDGNCLIYLRSSSFERRSITLFFGLFMNVHTEQQNKLSFIEGKKQTVYNYFVFKRENEIEL